MPAKAFSTVILFLVLILSGSILGAIAAEKPESPRIDCVIPLPEQPQAKDPATIWYDDFDGIEKPYAESKGPLDSEVAFGMRGKSMLCLYEKGKVDVAGRKVFFGDSPVYLDRTARRGEKFSEVYWRIYVKHQYGWIGSPGKMSRAMILANDKWAQAMIVHVWSGDNPGSITLDPVRGVQGNRVVTRKYNDFEHMTWLGNKPESKFPIHSTKESGYWVMVECRVKLNTPGKNDGLAQLWIDGRLECERRNLNLRGTYTEHGINAIFLEAYWNEGSPVTQSLWYDNFVISTKPIGPVVCPSTPTIIKTPYRGSGKAGEWEVEVASDYEGKDVVYRSRRLPPNNRTTIDADHGRFCGSLDGKRSLTPGKIYYLRVRQSNSDGVFSDWSRWHQGFKVK